MTHKKVKLIVFLLLGLGFTGLNAQEAIPAAGGSGSGSGGSVSYTVGLVLYTTNIATNGSVAHGVQQPWEISVINGLEEADGISLFCSVYPNPAIDLLILKVENYDKKTLSYQLYDIRGKLLENRKITAYQTSVSLGNYASSTYFLKVSNNDKETKVFKIIKNQ